MRVVDKLLEPKEMELPVAAYEGSKLADDPRYGKPRGSAQLVKTLAVYDRADSAAARVIIVAGSEFEGTSPKLFWPETLVYSLPGAELNQMLTLVVAMKSEMPCETELLLFAGMNDHLHAAGLLEQLKGDAPMPKKIWEAIQTLFAAMNEVQENANSRFGPKTKVVFATSHALMGFYELADILIVLDEVLLLEISNLARQLKFSPVIGDHPIISHLTASLWFRGMDLTITSSTSKLRGPSNERKNVAAAEKQLEAMLYRLTQERGR